jgi:integrase
MARERAFEARRRVAEGNDPLSQRAKSQKLTFGEAAHALITAKRESWRNAKHAAQWTCTLERYVFPSLGDRDVQSIETDDVLAVLNPIWTQKPETASRVRQRIEAVLDYATALGKREGANPARWRGHLDQVLAQPNKVRTVAHFPAMDWREAPGFMSALSECSGVAAQALAFAILTAARSGEVRGATWSEFDLEQGVWTVPAARMKTAKPRANSVSSARRSTRSAVSNTKVRMTISSP